jgi:uncharacterized protein YjeT (DUF2065 family)
MKNISLVTAVLLGLLALANGTFMLVAPADWYVAIPGVTTTGPFNQHFLRDIGLIFLLVGIAFLAGAARPQYRAIAWGGATLWLCGHALFHVWEVAAGMHGSSDLVRDFPAVSLPAILGVLITLWSIADARSRPAPAAK